MAKLQKFTDQFKTKVGLEARRGDKAIQGIAVANHQIASELGQHMEAPGCRRHGRNFCPWRQTARVDRSGDQGASCQDWEAMEALRYPSSQGWEATEVLIHPSVQQRQWS